MRQRLTYANVIATLALFIALGGGAYGAFKLPKNSVGSKQLRARSVTGAKLAKRAVNGSKVKPDSLGGAQVKESSLEKVPAAATADSASRAGSAGNADDATHALNADTLGGIPPSAFGRSVTYVGQDFKPESSTLTYSTWDQLDIYNTSGSSGSFRLPVSLPQGAVITRVNLYVVNNGGPGILAGFQRERPETEERQSLGGDVTTTNSPTVRTLNLTPPASSPTTVDNGTYRYVISVLLSSVGTSERIIGARVDYRL